MSPWTWIEAFIGSAVGEMRKLKTEVFDINLQYGRQMAIHHVCVNKNIHPDKGPGTENAILYKFLSVSNCLLWRNISFICTQSMRDPNGAHRNLRRGIIIVTSTPKVLRTSLKALINWSSFFWRDVHVPYGQAFACVCPYFYVKHLATQSFKKAVDRCF